MDDHLIINLRVADMRYPIKIERSKEEIYRKAANEIDYKIGQYKNYFQGESSQSLSNTDYLVMTAIQAVSEKVEQETRANQFRSRISTMIDVIENYLDEK